MPTIADSLRSSLEFCAPEMRVTHISAALIGATLADMTDIIAIIREEAAKEERGEIAAMFDEEAALDDAEAAKYEARNDYGDPVTAKDLRLSAEENRERAARIRARGSK